MKKRNSHLDIEVYRHADQKPRFMKERENDPPVYGYICPKCEERYGDPQRNGYVDIVRCKKCPELNFGKHYYE